MSDVPEVRLTGKAARFVQILQDFGHLDEDSAMRLLLEVDPSGLLGDDLADLDDVRRAAAIALFERADGDITGILGEDWPLLFS